MAKTCWPPYLVITREQWLYRLAGNGVDGKTLSHAGLWNSAKFLGFFLGPTVGGILIDSHGYQVTALVFIGLYCLATTADLMELGIVFVWKSHVGTLRDEKDQKLRETAHLLNSQCD